MPGGRPELLAGRGQIRPDAVVLDLEDSVAPADKDRAREAAFAILAAGPPVAAMVLVRINPAGSPWHGADAVAAAEAIQAEASTASSCRSTRAPRNLSSCGRPCRRAPGSSSGWRARSASPTPGSCSTGGPDAAYFGAEDFAADSALGAPPAASRCLRPQRGRAGLPVTRGDPAGPGRGRGPGRRGVPGRRPLGRDLGYRGKICLHPSQVELAHEIFTPSEAEVAHAHDVLHAAAPASGW